MHEFNKGILEFLRVAGAECLAACAGLQTDRPAVEAWLVCSDPVSIPPQCLHVSFLTDRPVSASFYPDFSTTVASTFRFVVNYKGDQHTSNGFVTLNLESARSVSAASNGWICTRACHQYTGTHHASHFGRAWHEHESSQASVCLHIVCIMWTGMRTAASARFRCCALAPQMECCRRL
jgi:hypothetical protein